MANVSIIVLLLGGPLLYGFCRAMLYQCGLCRHAVSVRPSFCASITFVYSVETNKHIFNFFTAG